MEIKFFNRKKGVVEIEQVYGNAVIQWLYGTFLGKLISFITSMSFVSKIYGAMQNRTESIRKIPSFIRQFDIDMELFENYKYGNFNDFFIRKFKDDQRIFVSEIQHMPAFCEARYLGWKSIEENMLIPVKGKYLTPKALLGKKWCKSFDGGPLMIARLCPVDYHRFHFPDAGIVEDSYRLSGRLHSVSPIALKQKGNILCTNERHITILDTENFGKLAYVEVGATCVGKIVQTHKESSYFRGDEKGYFLFGGSTVILIGQAGKFQIDSDILERSLSGLETLIELGQPIATKR